MLTETELRELLAPQPAPVNTAQSRPVLNDDSLPAVPADVKAALKLRREFGMAKYGTELHSHNGRDPLADALQEAIDQTVYLQQACMERPDSGLRKVVRQRSAELALLLMG